MREMLKLEKCHQALAIIDSLHGQTTPDFLSLLETHKIVAIIVPAYCTDKLQPIDVSINRISSGAGFTIGMLQKQKSN